IFHSNIKVTKMSYDEADNLLAENADLSALKTAAEKHQKYRDQQGAISLNLPNVEVKFKDDLVTISKQNSSPSRDLIAEMMVLAGRVIAQFSQQNEIVMPYAIQDAGDFPAETLEAKNQLTLAQAFKAMKYFKRSATSVKPLLHYGLGLSAYLRITSPLRRYFDLLAHQQLSNFILGKPTLEREKVKQIIGITNTSMADIGKTVRSSNDHYKCLFLLQNPQWQGAGVVVDLRGDKALFMLPELGMMTQIKFKNLPDLDAEILLKISSVDLPQRLANFQPA
ncbi:MAG: RNB domain-containing ribonuclease, partial [Candidatus Thioglobus sp.]|nr:RNB domain-containing ribonuclease [Candidatus Thioglobus sp.]